MDGLESLQYRVRQKVDIISLFHCRDNRYVLFLTENYAALEILKNPKNYLGPVINSTPSDDLSIQPFVLFGSSFPKDKEYTQVVSIVHCNC